MRHISCALTEQQILDETKGCTRRLGWLDVKVGELLQVVRKSMGRKPGEPLVKLKVIRVTDVRREPLSRMIHEQEYGRTEAILEGFPDLDGFEFACMFSHEMKCEITREITRIAFEYVD